jgi:hypothetical protein
LFAGCQSAKRPPLRSANDPIDVKYQDEAARGGLAVVSVAPWDEYAATLQPVFALTTEQALAQALPTTSRQTSDLIDALAVGLKLAPPTSARSSTRTETTTDGVATSERTTTSSRQPGDVSQVTLPEMPEGGTPRSPTANPLDGSIEGSAFARYGAATALFQEVQLLNSYVRDAALARGQQAFIVRLQVSLLPRLRGQAYDATSTISFFLDAPDPAKKAVTDPVTGPVINPYAQRKTQPESRGRDPKAASNARITVLPILVTDSLEQSFAALSASRSREFALALAALVSGFGASGDFSRRLQELQSAIGTDYNALQTVTKVAGNTLRVRFGAQQQVGSGLAMVPSNHTVTAVLLVPAPVPAAKSYSVTVQSKTEVVRATDGVVLDQRPFSDVARQVEAAVARYLPPSVAPSAGSPSPSVNDLAYAAMSNNRLAFNTTALALDIDESAWGTLWLDLVDIGSRSAYAITSFELPGSSSGTTVEAQHVSVIDDGTAASALIRGLRGIDVPAVSASLRLHNSAPAPNNIAAVVPGKVAAAGPGSIRIDFPSLTKLELCANPKPCPLSLEIYRTNPITRWDESSGQQLLIQGNLTVGWVPVPKEKPKPPEVFFTMSVGAQQIMRTPAGAGTVQLMFQRAEDHASEPMYFTLSGADIASIAPAGAATLSRHGWLVNAPAGGHAALTVTLANLSDEADVRIVAGNTKAKREPITLRVRTVPAPPAK